MNLRQFQYILIQSLMLPLLALLVVALVLAVQIRNAQNTVTLMQRSQQNIAETATLSRLIVDEETGLRGYQTTDDPQFLQPYNAAQKPIADSFAQLRATAGTDAEMIQRIDELFAAHQLWKESFAAPVITTMQAGGQASDVQLNLQGKTLMDNVRARVGAIIGMQAQRQAQRVAEWRAEARHTLQILVASALAAGLCIGLFTRNRLQRVSYSFQKTLDALRRQAQEVFESEQKLRITLASIGDGVIVCSVNGIIEMMNGVAQDLTGWKEAESLGLPIGKVFNIVNETTRQLVENPVDKVKRLNRVVGLANHTILIRKDSSEINIDDSGAPIRDLSETMVGIVMVFRDITMERRTQAALLTNEKLAVAGRLAATIAHEIHNPLDSVSNVLYLLRNGGTTLEENEQFLAVAQQELARVTQISRAMLGLYRESKSPVPIDLKEMLDSILLLMERRFAELKVQIETDIPEGVSFHGFPAELRQVFTNLITNAAEAAPSGKVQIKVTKQTGNADMRPGVLIEVADNGLGVPEEIRQRLFQPFFTTKGEQGTGLGLWVSRGIVQKHEGTITLISSIALEDHGTKVRVFFPEKFIGEVTK